MPVVPVVKYLDPVRDELDRLRAVNETLTAGNRVACARFETAERRVIELTAELDLTRDTLRRRTQSHANLVATRLACPHCRTLPLEETPSE